MVDGTNYIIWIDTVTPRSNGFGMDYRPVMCGVSNNFGMENQGIEYRNKNDGGWVQEYYGYNSWSIDMDGQAIAVKNSEKLIKANFHEVAKLLYNKVEFWIRQTDADLTIVREGWAKVGTYRETADMSSPYSFTASFKGIGKPLLDTNLIKTVLATDLSGLEVLEDGNNRLIEDKDGN